MKYKILLLAKRSSYDYYLGHLAQDKLKYQGHEGKKIIERFKHTHEVHYESLKQVEKILKDFGFDYKKYFRGDRIDYSKYNMIITVGGDGTFIEASHHIITQIILGVNSDPSWSVGRFCAINVKQLKSYLTTFSPIKIDLVQRFNVSIKGQKKQYHVLNEVLFCHQNPAGLTRYLLKIGNKAEEQRCSGIWVSSAAGSTGAVYSAGGQKLPITGKLIQYKPRELFIGRSNGYQLKGGAFKAHKSFSLVSLIREGVVYIDGSHICLSMPFGSKLTIEPSKYPLRMLKK